MTSFESICTKLTQQILKVMKLNSGEGTKGNQEKQMKREKIKTKRFTHWILLDVSPI